MNFIVEGVEVRQTIILVRLLALGLLNVERRQRLERVDPVAKGFALKPCFLGDLGGQRLVLNQKIGHSGPDSCTAASPAPAPTAPPFCSTAEIDWRTASRSAFDPFNPFSSQRSKAGEVISLRIVP